MKKQHTQAGKNLSSPKGQPSFFQPNEIFKQQLEQRAASSLCSLYIKQLFLIFLSEGNKPKKAQPKTQKAQSTKQSPLYSLTQFESKSTAFIIIHKVPQKYH